MTVQQENQHNRRKMTSNKLDLLKGHVHRYTVIFKTVVIKLEIIFNHFDADKANDQY